MKFKNFSPKKKILLILSALVIIAAVVIVICYFSGKEEDVEEPPVIKELPIVDAPMLYELEELADVLALPVGASDAIVVRADIPEEVEEDPSVEPSEEPAEAEKESHPLTVAVTYHYEGIPAVQSRVELYCSLLTAEDFGFVPVDGEMMETVLPTFEEITEGAIHLVLPIRTDKSGAEVKEATLFSLQISWNAEKCVITVGRIAGKIVVPRPENNYRPPLTIATAVDYFYSCHPSQFGLPGESMDVYQVLPLDGAVLVGTMPCLRINVYAIDEKTGTNVIAGQYLLADNGMQLYRIDEKGNIVALPR